MKGCSRSILFTGSFVCQRIGKIMNDFMLYFALVFCPIEQEGSMFTSRQEKD
jgi:hypothetical protein